MPVRERHRVLSDTVGPSRTKQSFRGESDINAIMRKYLSTGVPPSYVNRAQAMFGDFSGSSDYLEMMLKVKSAQDVFAALPSAVRNACDNDPAKLLDIVFDPAQQDKLVQLGLATKAPAPSEDPPVTPPVEPPA